jgi:hypothetical protein
VRGILSILMDRVGILDAIIIPHVTA